MNSAILMFERTAARLPNKIAVSDEQQEITFGALRAQALSIATELLQTKDVLRPVMVYLPKGVDPIKCFLGALYSGNPYVPIDDKMPLTRLQSIIGSIGAGHLITSRALAQGLAELDLIDVKLHIYEDMIATPSDEAACLEKVSLVIDSDPIYIIFTSGSTGVPKGVTIPHRGIIDYSAWLEETFHFDENTVLGNQSAFYFDNSTFDIYTMCRTGAHMIIIPEKLFLFPVKLPEFLAEHHINTFLWVPTVMMGVADSGALSRCALPELKTILFAGEAMPNKHLNVWRRALPDALYGNLYGPTEITDICCYYIVDREFEDTQPLPIGKACKNMRLLILREDGTEAAPGEQGELCILGSGLARGYWNAQETTRKVFTQNPLSKYYDDRMYHSGDLVNLMEDGNINFIGRMDSQIKLRGNRIELGEIETAAKSLDGIENAIAVLDEVNQEIVLFAQTQMEWKLNPFRNAMRKLVQIYMVPTKLICMKEFPLTPSGKVDRVTLKGTLS